MVFRSKVDFWLVCVLVAAPIVLLDFLLDGLNRSDKLAEAGVFAIVVSVLGLFAWFYFTTRYTITGDFLMVKSGPFTWIIPIEDITSIGPTRNAASSPALSLDRLMIRYGQAAELMISPRDKSGFMAELRKYLKPMAAAMHP